MSQLKDSIASLVPLAKALVEIDSKLAELELLDEDIVSREKVLGEFEARATKAEDFRAEALASVQKSKSEVIEARANCDKMVSSARQVASKIINDAKAQATEEAEAIKSAATESIAMLTQKEAEARRALAQVESTLAARRRDHDQVLASISSLKDRLGAA